MKKTTLLFLSLFCLFLLSSSVMAASPYDNNSNIIFERITLEAGVESAYTFRYATKSGSFINETGTEVFIATTSNETVNYGTVPPAGWWQAPQNMFASELIIYLRCLTSQEVVVESSI